MLIASAQTGIEPEREHLALPSPRVAPLALLPPVEDLAAMDCLCEASVRRRARGGDSYGLLVTNSSVPLQPVSVPGNINT